MIFKSLKQKDLLEETIITIKPTPGDALEEQINLKNEIDRITKSTKIKIPDKREKRHWLLKTQIDFLKEDKNFAVVYKTKYFQ